ncbi:hypothetical protein AVEN_241583-1 [Araneus ventricosus]|uniref:Uncharacterized protein n=1 Tax=Araneus ventricosus TaxID=182803 RepID=A0A4Y2H514_ARAVE|nr:hypothetical protein AVEN_241583-1 [Araneus ventricosus]
MDIILNRSKVKDNIKKSQSRKRSVADEVQCDFYTPNLLYYSEDPRWRLFTHVTGNFQSKLKAARSRWGKECRYLRDVFRALALTSPRATSILPVPAQTTDEALERQAVGTQIKCGKNPLSLPPVRSCSKQNNVLRQGQKWMKEEADDKEY